MDEKILIQAKRYAEGDKVGSREIREYSSLRRQEKNVDAVAVVTTSSFSQDAKNIAGNLKVKLIDGKKLINSIYLNDLEKISEKYNTLSNKIKEENDSETKSTNNTEYNWPQNNTRVPQNH